MSEDRQIFSRLEALQKWIISFYNGVIQLSFNIAIFILIFSLLIGIWKTVESLKLVLTEITVRASFKELVTNVLSLIVVLELIRAFVDYFEYERVRIEIILEVLIAFIIREFMILLFKAKLTGLEVFLWCGGIIIIVLARTLSIVYKPDKKLTRILRNEKVF